MSKVHSLQEARLRKATAASPSASRAVTQVPTLSAEEYRAELVGYASEFGFPGDQYDDAEFGAAISRESHDKLLRIFSMFGVTKLDPSEQDFELVLNTWFVLAGRVGMHLRLRQQFKTAAYDVLERQWSSDYRAYVNALWDGDGQEIARVAAVLAIDAGIPNDFPEFYAEL